MRMDRAADAGVERLIVTAGTLEESKQAISFIRSHRNRPSPVGLYSAVGVHRPGTRISPIRGSDEIEEAMKAVAENAGRGAASRPPSLRPVLARPHVVAAIAAL